MMNLHALVVVSAALAALIAGNPVPAQTPDLERIAAVADSMASAQMAGGAVPGMTIAVAHNGEVVFTRGYGSADVEMGVAASPESVYKIGSITKQMTAAIVMRLVEAGRISLDDPITKYLPGYPVQGHHVTVRHLLNHTSGIKAFRVMNEENRQRFRADLTYQDIVNLYGSQPFEFEPGTAYAYNNTAFYLLGEIITRVTGTPYAEYVERELIQPLGLGQTVYCDDSRVIPNRVRGYEFEGGRLVNARYLSIRNASAAGALCSTAADLVRWTGLLHGGRVVPPASLRQMTAPTVLAAGDTSGYGFGLQLDELGGHPKVFHTGGVNGFVSMLSHYPQDGLTVAVLINSLRGNPVEVEKALARAALGVQVRDLPVAAEDVARYEGTYTWGVGQSTREARIFGEDGTLKMQMGRQAIQLLAQGGDAFIPAADQDTRIVFAVRDGRAEGFTIHEGRWDVTPATRKP